MLQIHFCWIRHAIWYYLSCRQ